MFSCLIFFYLPATRVVQMREKGDLLKTKVLKHKLLLQQMSTKKKMSGLISRYSGMFDDDCSSQKYFLVFFFSFPKNQVLVEALQLNCHCSQR